jgi:hypothetical protein
MNAWKKFENVSFRMVPNTSLVLGDAASGSPNGMRNPSCEVTSSDSTVPARLSDAAAAVGSFSANSNDGQQNCSELAPLLPQPVEQAIDQGDGSEFWS